jgi:hypothetical protein
MAALSLLIAASTLAQAGVVTNVGEPVTLSMGGGWARAFPTDDGQWHFLWAAGGEYNLLPMSAALGVIDSGRTLLTGRTDLVDHGITRCPDGSYLHAASANLDEFNDSAFAFRYTADWQRTAAGTLAEREAGREHNDLLVLCSPLLDATLFVEGGPNNPVLVEIAEDGSPAGETRLDTRTNLMGGSMVWDPDTDTLVTVGFNNTQSIVVERWDADLVKLETIEVPAVPAPQRVYWTQATLRAGDHWLVAHMARDDSAGWAADEGNVWLQVFDLDWNLLESHPVTDFAPPAGGMRPGLARQDDRLLVLFDKGVQPHVVPVTLDTVALGEDPELDTGADPADQASEAACGCAAGGTASGWSVVLLAGASLALRRRSER